MLKRLLLIGLVLVLATQAVVLAQETEFRFSNWPLAGFEQHKIINSFSENHFGVDLSADTGEEVKAVAGGTVYWTYSGGSHGIAVGIEHENGWRTTYLHLSERLVKKGQEVKAADIIGKVGTTGTGRDAEEPHLHFALIVDAAADVSDYSRRYADPLAFGPAPLEPAEQPVEEPVTEPVEQPVIQPPGEMPVVQPVEQALKTPALQEPVIQPVESPVVQPVKQPVTTTGGGKEPAFIRKAPETMLSPNAKEKAIRIKPAAVKYLAQSAKILSTAVKQRQPAVKAREISASGTRPGSSKSGNKGVILIYWLGLTATGYLYHLLNRKKIKGILALPR